MNMSPRERKIGTIAGAVVGALVLYQFVIDPQLTRIGELDEQIETASTEMDRAQQLFGSSRSATRKLSAMAGSGLRRTDSAAESELLNTTRQWAQEAGLGGWGIKREGTVKERDFNKITFRAQGTGGMGQIGRFLYRLQTANIPVRVADMTISSRKDGTDDLAIVLSISTIYLNPDAERPGGQQRPAGTGGPAPAIEREVGL
jgi:type II secretory pathway component PulM